MCQMKLRGQEEQEKRSHLKNEDYDGQRITIFLFFQMPSHIASHVLDQMTEATGIQLSLQLHRQ